jgi:metal-dependent amidase/aminoacylase/carboxypeptidase family protein
MFLEISYQERRTSDEIVEFLKEIGCEVQEFEDMTGAVGLINNSENGPLLA